MIKFFETAVNFIINTINVLVINGVFNDFDFAVDIEC